ncbi:MAG TPA: AraC family transcriptional regulator [Candidatus Sulfopaludibacter sp.]|nr:AraC family transcriptional regulator [Candidatus Sulfopaludibacter sp.]
MDALSDLLRVVRFSGGMFLESIFRVPWCVRSQLVPADCGPGVKADGGLVAFHYVLDGRMQVRVGGEPLRMAGPGNIILLSRNDPHLLGSDVAMPPIDARPLIRKAEEDVLARLDFGTGRQVKNRFVCGFLATAVRDHPLLTALPALLVADLHGRPCAEWAESSFRYAAREHAARRPASQEILARLSEMLFVEAVRGYIAALPGNATGWLAALRDPSLSRALGVLHLRPAHAWTAEELAKEACLSRSAFAERFTSTVGLPPMSYLTRWRMLLAGQRLRESSDTLAQVAAAVGYESEFSFSRAFARETGVTPGAWRKSGEG